MRSAPAVSYPVRRSRLQAGFLALLGLSGIIVAGLWRDSFDAIGWRQYSFTTLFVGAWLCAWVAWLRTSSGFIRWDGQTWSWQGAKINSCDALKVHLDLQGCLLLSVVLSDGQRLWLWPERGSHAVDWMALRRAIFYANPAEHLP